MFIGHSLDPQSGNGKSQVSKLKWKMKLFAHFVSY